MNKRIAIFCGSSMGVDPIYKACAQEVGRKLVAHKLDLVYGGGSVGLMGVVADEVLSLKGQVTGVITEKLHAWEVGHAGLTQLHIVNTMHERKALMAQLSDGFIALPGGIGTLEEITEVYTWLQLGYHQKPCGFLNVAGYYDAFIALLDQMVIQGFLDAKSRNLIIIKSNIDDLLAIMSINN